MNEKQEEKRVQGQQHLSTTPLSPRFFDHLTKGFSSPFLLNGPLSFFSSGLLFLHGEKLNVGRGGKDGSGYANKHPKKRVGPTSVARVSGEAHQVSKVVLPSKQEL